MIFYYDASGNRIKSLQSYIYQGSNKVNRLWFVMPTDKTNTVMVSFRLANGTILESVPMTNSYYNGLESENNGIYDPNENSAWFYDIPKAVTSVAGTLTVQFFVYKPDGETVATASENLVVLKGVTVILPDKLNSSEEVLHYLAIINNTVLDSNNKVKEVDALAKETLQPIIDNLDILKEIAEDISKLPSFVRLI